MAKRSGLASLLLAAGLAAVPYARAEGPVRPAVMAGRLDVESALAIDGALDEPAWATAGVIADLTQQDPEPGTRIESITITAGDSFCTFWMTRSTWVSANNFTRLCDKPKRCARNETC